jgi:type VII secretion protein EccE
MAIMTRTRSVPGAVAGQIVVVETAAVAVLAAWRLGPAAVAFVSPVVVVALLLALVRVRGRWAFRWALLGLRYAGRRRVLAGSDGTLDVGRSESAGAGVELDGLPVAVIDDAGGPTAIIAVGDTDAMFGDAGPAMPPLSTLLPPAEPGQPVTRLRLIAATVSAPAPGAGTGPAAGAYRQLTGGRIASYRRLLVAVQVRRDAGTGEEVLRRSLVSAVRRIRRRLERAGLTATLVAPGAVPGILAELAHHDPTGPACEHWPALTVGGLHQVTFRLDGFGPSARDERAPHEDGQAGPRVSLPARLLALPGCTVTLALAVERERHEAALRIAAAGPDELAAAVSAVRQLLVAAGVGVRRLDGAHASGLAATLPLGGTEPLERPGPADGPADLLTGGAGVMLGTNRHGVPVTIAAFRPAPTRIVLVGEPHRAQLVALRAVATGARLYLQTARPQAWDPFLRAISGPDTAVTVLSPGRGSDAPPATPARPQLVLVDAPGPAASHVPLPQAPWRTTVMLRDRITAADVDLLSHADLALLARVSDDEAVLAGASLGLGTTADWLTRIQGDMLGAVVPRTTVRWAMAVPTPSEARILGRT